MHVKELLLLAADVVLEAPEARWFRQGLPPDALNDYWAASKARMDLWFAQLKRYRQEYPQQGPEAGRALWRRLRATLEELLASEVLTRTWAAAVTLWEQDGPREAEPVARSVVVAHTEARLRAMTLLLHAPGVPAQEAMQLNQLRGRAQRWCDMLVGRLGAWGPVTHWAHDPSRALELARELKPPVQGTRNALRHLLRASLQRAFWPLLTQPAACPTLNRRIYQAVRRWLPQHPEETLLHVPLEDHWSDRLQRISDYTLRMVEELLALEGGAAGSLPDRSGPRRQ